MAHVAAVEADASVMLGKGLSRVYRLKGESDDGRKAEKGASYEIINSNYNPSQPSRSRFCGLRPEQVPSLHSESRGAAGRVGFFRRTVQDRLLHSLAGHDGNCIRGTAVDGDFCSLRAGPDCSGDR